ncbi:MAG: hypothetical protein RQ767_07620, partial [Thermovirgaceae bacterium]|nr:hypothetical protein [Thermovirgaceae bacterium]
WKLSMLYLDGFFRDDENLRKGILLLNEAIEERLPHAVWYGSVLLSDPQQPFYNPERGRELQQIAADLGFPPPGPYAVPELPRTD